MPRSIKTGPQFRDLLLKREAINVEKRTVEVAFSSEAPVERWWGTEILDHGNGSMRLGRLRDGAAVLINHDPNDQVGVVENASVGADRIGRATVRFGKGARATEIFGDVVDGIRTKLSVGYTIHKMRMESEDEGTQTYRATDWEPFELTFTPVPADPSVGVGRSAPPSTTETLIEERTMPPNETPEEKAARESRETAAGGARALSQAQITEQLNEVRTRELARINELEKLGQKFKDYGGEEVARQMIGEGKSVGDFQTVILERVGKPKPPSADLGMNDREIRQFSFLRAINAMANPNDKTLYNAAAFEREVSEAAAKRAGVSPKGFLVPTDVLRTPLLMVEPGSRGAHDNMEAMLRAMHARAQTEGRTLNVGTASAGGATVATDLLAASFIELLRNRMLLTRLGITTLNGLVGNIAIPRQTGGATAYWVAETNAPTTSQQTVDQVTMTPKTVGAYTDYSRKLLLQSAIDIENFVRMDLVKIIGLELDRAGLYGSGSSNQPLGVANQSGINTVSFGTAGQPTFPEIVSMETKVAASNADVGTLAYATNATMRGYMKSTAKIGSTYPVFLWDTTTGATPVNGYRTEVSNQVVKGTAPDNGDVWFGNWADLVMGVWSGLDLLVDPYSNSTSGTIRLVALQDIDICVRHPVSFCKGR